MDLLFQQGRYKEALTLADQTSKESLKLVCWDCNAPIDPSKPVKPYELEEDFKKS